MPQPRVIVGVGAALLAENGDQETPAGLAATVPLLARRLGHRGVSISRLGQDAAARTLRAELSAAGIDVTHLQSDPDWPTGRLRLRTLAGRTSTTLDSEAAFDHLQWDFDLADVAQEADAVVFGRLGRRRGQAASTIAQFLGSCRDALRVFDFIDAVDGPLDRERALSALEFAEGCVVDPPALRGMVPSAAPAQPPEQMARELIRAARLQFAIIIDSGSIALVTPEDAHAAACAQAECSHVAGAVALLHGLLAGWNHAQCVRAAAAIAGFIAAHPSQPVPAKYLEPPQ